MELNIGGIGGINISELLTEALQEDINLFENEDHNEIIAEQMLLESIFEDAIERVLNEDEEVMSLEERTIVKLDKKAKFKRAVEASIYAIAREKGDPIFKKLVTAWKLERFYTKKLQQKYRNQAIQRVKKVAKEKKNKQKAKGGSITNMVKRHTKSTK